MLNQDEENYLAKISDGRVVVVKPYDKRVAEIAKEIISKIKDKHPELEIIHMGASGLKISGQGDVDIYAFAKPDSFKIYLPTFTQLFGQPKSTNPDSIAWELVIEDYPVELYLTNPDSTPMKRQITVFNVLRNNSKLLSKYEQLKADMNGKSFKEYQRKKYQFYHEILSDRI